MSRGALSERQAIALLERLFAPGAARPRVEVGIGDDAAVLSNGSSSLVWTTDVCVENVHFERSWLSFEDVGFRSFQAAVSDLAAMGARPLAALSSLIVPAHFAQSALLALGRGQAEAARELGCPIIGGNISRGSELSVTTTALGETRRPVLRNGARSGDALWLVGEVGLSRAGLLLLKGARPGASRWRRAERVCIDRWRRPRALIAEGVRISGRASAMLDLSDGLAGDALRLAEASRVRLLVDEELLRAALRPELVSVCSALGIDALDVALKGGEDYALLVTSRPSRRLPNARRIGSVVAGSGAFLRRAAGGRLSRLAGGFDHFA